ncbi:MAG: acyl-CoA dehydrogenase, partial [Deltaproteobacteria bacterium]|nr:acyl-CoA dehydrogenase [Deltaproteobacteria bacterium]
MTQGINRYKADLRDLKFLLFEHFKTQELMGTEPFKDWAQDDAEMILGEVYKWACDRLGPLNSIGDSQGCTLDPGGNVKTPEGYKQAWDELGEMGFTRLAAPEEVGGSGGPFTVGVAAGELMTGANVAFMMYPGLSIGVAHVLEHFGTDDQKQHVQKLYDGTFGGTMCLTEPHAGSDVGANNTKATPLGDGKYKIEGTKIYISAGNHDLSENILHLVLARTPEAPSGTKGLSLFIVPRDKLDGTGSNNVVTASLEHKMGINGSATAVLNFGEGGDCIGQLVGTDEQVGIKQMFMMMNGARIEVGIQGLALAGAAYMSALDYAKDRKQGPSVKNWKDPEAPKVPIIQHPDVRRMLLDMKSKVEGIRALLIKLADHWDRANVASGKDDDAATYHRGQVDLLVPLVKAYASDQAFEISATAIQVFGGAGYLKDWPVEQYCRDSKIFSIYEGTNHIQALDLVGRKLGQRGGANF